MRMKGIGLVGQGAVGFSYLVRLPSFVRQLSVVKGTNHRTSSRLRNTLRAGRWVNDYAALDDLKMIWIAVGEEALDGILSELAGAVILTNRMVVICDTVRDSLSFPALNQANARVATLFLMPEASERIFIAEGNEVTLKELRRMMAADKRKLIELRPGTKALYVSGLHLSAHLLMPWLGAAVESFRFAGLSRSEATLAMQAIGGASLRAYIRAGEKALNLPDAQRMQTAVDKEREAIRKVNPRLAEFYDGDAGKWLRYVGGKRFWHGSKETEAQLAANEE
jgi:predicted short-subunit dehydrogenase-like oxidoreductase (DUF2520 family)